MTNEQQELLDEVFLNYWRKVSVNNEEDCLVKQEEGSFLKEVRVLYQQEFINKCKTDPEFSQRWRLKIEERELSLEERAKWLEDTKGYDLLVGNLDHDHIREVVEEEAPTKLIKVTYNDKTIESYE